MTRQHKAQEKRTRRAVRRCLSAARDPRDRVLRGLSLSWPWMMPGRLPFSGAVCALLGVALGPVLGATRPATESAPAKIEPPPHTLSPRSAVALSVLMAGASMGRR